MVHELKIPNPGESIQEVQIGQWLKKEGQRVERDEVVVELETDKASLDLSAPVAGVLLKILKPDGATCAVGEVIGQIDESAKPATAPAAEAAPKPLPAPQIIMPAAQRLLAEHGLQARDVKATGPGGRLLKEDVLRHIEAESQIAPAADSTPAAPPAAPTEAPQAAGNAAEVAKTPPAAATAERQEDVVPMSLIRRRIAERLVRAQQDAALLTTFNETDMSAVIGLRQKYRERFQEKHGVKLGFMSFFTRAAVEALREFPAINAEIRGTDIVYRRYCDIGIAIASSKGLVVPVLRSAERLSLAEIERRIADFAERAEANKIRPPELAGGTFTITNGGVYGSLLSTPIINPPQSGVLGLHAIQERPVARDGQVVIRPMMYVALTYDHRIVDGREAVTFLKRIKEIIEEPARILLEV
jgi:2-oxoglutarate dehydrogenase E2 component (dihydrolipoamide succinyltransferase)